MTREESSIQQQVEDALRNSRLSGAADIKVTTRNGEVTIYGLVDVLAEKWAAEEIILQVHGVSAVDNSLTVAMDRMVDEKEIAEAVLGKLSANPQVNLHNISAKVIKGVVYLDGEAASLAEEEAAKEISARVYGVKDVISRIQIGGALGARDDATLTNEVETALSRSTAVSVRDIETKTYHGKVTLRGTVDTPDQIEAARRIAAQIPGVKGVRSLLDSRHGSQDADMRLTNEIREELGRNGLSGVKCFVEDGTAFLSGAVDNPDQVHRAQEVIKQFSSIEGVSNDIQTR